MAMLVRPVSRPVVRQANTDDAGGGRDPDDTAEGEVLWSDGSVMLWSDGGAVLWSN